MLEQEPVGLTDLKLYEILQGIRSDQQVVAARVLLKKVIIFDTRGEALAIESADNYRSLRHRGYTIRRTIDYLIATFCLRKGHTPLHRDRDFDVFEQHLGLNILHP